MNSFSYAKLILTLTLRQLTTWIKLSLTKIVKVLSALVLIIYRFLIRIMAIAVLMVFIFRAEDIHKHFLRNWVGSRVYKIMSAPNSGGTAFSIRAPSGKTFLITNDHICSSSNGVLYLVDGPLSHRISVIERSLITDLCLLTAPLDEIGLEMATSSPYAGDSVRAIGHPKLDALTVSNKGEIISIMSVEFSDNTSIYRNRTSATASCDTANPKWHIEQYNNKFICFMKVPAVYSTSVLVKKGNSGSPLVDFQGDVVGVINGVDEYGWGTAVTYDEVVNFLKNR